jgi:dTDP-4-dehydrorhamnose 3,5-epimerase
MELTPLEIEGAWLAESPVWEDERGNFREWFKSSSIKSLTGLDFNIAQANVSKSIRNIVRGIHYSLAEGGQAKWITCVAGSIKDVIVDIRISSPTYGKYVSVDLLAGDGRAVFVGAGLGHGFVSIADESTVVYLMTTQYSPIEEFEINPFDPTIGIDWGTNNKELKVSNKDATAPYLNERRSQGKLPK